MIKSCSRCKIEKPYSDFNKESKRPDGLQSKCRDCQRILRVSYYNRYGERERSEMKKYKSERPWLRRTYEAKRRALKKKSVCLGFSKELKDVYRNCPTGHQVDHIVPLAGKNVTGLHVPWNLQYLTPEENMKKSNKFGEL